MEEEKIPVKIYNTPQRKKVDFEPYVEGKVNMYSCGPTVYNTVHVGNLRSLVNFDVVGRALRYMGYDVERVVNFTDVGHMTGDVDFGEDKVESQARKEDSDVFSISNKYIYHVVESFRKLNVLNPNGTAISENIDVGNLSKEKWAKWGWARATDYIPEMIELIGLIERNGHTYETDQALYFDISTFPGYHKFAGQDLEEKKTAARESVQEDSEKKHPADFVLWMKRYGKYKDHIMHWDSPWGDGFPGWHIECSAMSWKLLGEQIDIHTGGADLINVHHPNEIAQNYGAFGHEVVKYWLHNEFVFAARGDKLSKSEGDAPSLKDIEEANVSLMALRWYYLSSNYRAPMKFSLDSLKSADKSYKKVLSKLKGFDNSKDGVISQEYLKKFKKALADNFNTPVALAILNSMLRSDLKPGDKVATAFEFDKVLGLDLEKTILERVDVFEKKELTLSDIEDIEIREMLTKREQARIAKDWEGADKWREILKEKGYKVIDKPDGQYVVKY